MGDTVYREILVTVLNWRFRQSIAKLKVANN